MHQGFVHTFLRFRSRICNNSLAERLLFQVWNFSLSKLQAPSDMKARSCAVPPRSMMYFRIRYLTIIIIITRSLKTLFTMYGSLNAFYNKLFT